ncbi:UNVERIFIED_CONTAM: hypothetical protein K2H54_044628 [Gekko kuhli]
MDSLFNIEPILIVAIGAVEQLRPFFQQDSDRLAFKASSTPHTGSIFLSDEAKEGLQVLLQELLREDPSAGHLVGLLDSAVAWLQRWSTSAAILGPAAVVDDASSYSTAGLEQEPACSTTTAGPT